MGRDSTSHTLDAPGCMLTYDVHGDLADGTPLVLAGSPMGADGFGALAAQFTDRTLVTIDPRGAGRSPRTDSARDTQVSEHAHDLRLLLESLEVPAVDMFASSGGAVNALALAARDGRMLRTLVAHEPPAASALPDRDEALALAGSIRATYDRDGFGAAMAVFIRAATITGPLPDGFAAQPAANPAEFGLPADDDGSRDDPLVGLNMPMCLEFEHDLDALRTSPTRVVLAHGADSADELTGRAARALARGLGAEPVEFPGGHVAFAAADDPMMPGQPEAFARRLRLLLDH